METVKWALIAIAIVYFLFLIINGFIKTKRIMSKRIYSNFHTHTTFCDGKNTAEEMVLEAIKLNMPKLGFSSHSHLDFEPSWTMTEDAEKAYKDEVLRLKEQYKNQIEILLGIEQDYWSNTENLGDYDYVIGTVHCIWEKDTNNSAVDGGRASFDYAVEHYFDGDRMAAVERYFELVSELYERTNCDIIGHFDLITKHNEEYLKETGKPFVDTEDPRYIEAERKALEKLVATPVIFEINTGGMARGFRSTPYPSERVMEYLSEHNTPVILGSDSHKTETLISGFDEAMNYVKKYNLNLVLDPRIKS